LADPIKEDLPDFVSMNTIANYFDQRDLNGLHDLLHIVFVRSSRNTQSEQVKHPVHDSILSRGMIGISAGATTHFKLQHDLEQAEYLANVLEKRHGKNDESKNFFRSIVAPTYKSILKRFPSLDELKETNGLYPFMPPDKKMNIHLYHNKALYITNAGEEKLVDKKTEKTVPIINPTIQQEWSDERQKEYASKAHDGPPRLIVIDNLLTPQALEAMQSILYESTVWFHVQAPLEVGGCLTAYLDDGLHDKLLLQLALDLRDMLPDLFDDRSLVFLRARKYEDDYTEERHRPISEFTNAVANDAAQKVDLEQAIVVTIWLTPNEGNQDPETGGAILTDQTIERSITIPYQDNRALIFDAVLDYQTDQFYFRPEYTNRRMEVTLLFARRSDEKQRDDTGKVTQSSVPDQGQLEMGSSTTDEL